MVNFLNFTKHAVCGSTKLSATKYGRHIYNVKIDQDLDNGSIVAIGDIVEGTIDTYAMKASSDFEGIVDGIAANGHYYVRVIEPGDAVLLLNPELIYEDWTTQCKQASNYYNEKDSIVRGYQLEVGDIFELSVEGFTAEPSVGDSVSVDSSTYQLAAATSGGGRP